MAALEAKNQSWRVNSDDITPPLNLLPSGEEKGKNGERGKSEGMLSLLDGRYLHGKQKYNIFCCNV
jgi:hypothetical protein